MKTTIACAIAIALSPLAFAEHNTLTAAEKKDGWKLLFDGKSTAGWHSWKTKKALEAGAWVAEDGALTLKKKGAGDIYTSEAYENFEMSLEWKTKAKLPDHNHRSERRRFSSPAQRKAVYTVGDRWQLLDEP